ncbi:MAG TPA: hypothetical protein DDW52_10405 [Planctomycetaceae bacterium]|nr:hypothetical protein [Planctomycetaceae bacterium]
MDTLIARIRDAACRDNQTHWFDVATADTIAFVELSLDVVLPDILRRCYTEISNGGFGPSCGLTGLPGGYDSSWGDLIQSTLELRKLDECDDGWLPLFDFGCAEVLCVDIDDELVMVTSIEGEFHHEDYDLNELLDRWCNDEVPDLQSGAFRRLA